MFALILSQEFRHYAAGKGASVVVYIELSNRNEYSFSGNAYIIGNIIIMDLWIQMNILF